METKATVIATEGKYAIVETKRKSACDGCHKQKEGSSCAMCTLMGDKAELRTRANNPIGARVGDEVTFEVMRDGKVVTLKITVTEECLTVS